MNKGHTIKTDLSTQVTWQQWANLVLQAINDIILKKEQQLAYISQYKCCVVIFCRYHFKFPFPMKILCRCYKVLGRNN
jgi:hypothetical protein